jgi:hypothetical protein
MCGLLWLVAVGLIVVPVVIFVRLQNDRGNVAPDTSFDRSTTSAPFVAAQESHSNSQLPAIADKARDGTAMAPIAVTRVPSPVNAVSYTEIGVPETSMIVRTVLSAEERTDTDAEPAEIRSRKQEIGHEVANAIRNGIAEVDTGYAITVDVRGPTVILSGWVSAEKQRTTAAQRAGSVDGIEHVENQLRLR